MEEYIILTNGKIERFYETFQSRMMYFESIEELITWYNTKRPHMSLNWDELETPIQAFFTKVEEKKEAITIYYMHVTYGESYGKQKLETRRYILMHFLKVISTQGQYSG